MTNGGLGALRAAGRLGDGAVVAAEGGGGASMAAPGPSAAASCWSLETVGT